MLTNNAAPMLARTTRYHGAWCIGPAIKHDVRRQQRANLRREDIRHAVEAVLPHDDAQLDWEYDQAELAWLSGDLMDSVLEDDGFDVHAGLSEVPASFVVLDDPFDLPGAPGWGDARIDYADFKSGFRVTDRP